MSVNDLLKYLHNAMMLKLFQIGQTPVTVSSLVMFVIVITLFLLLSRIICRFVLKKLLERLNLEQGTQYNLLRLTHYIIIFFGALVAFQFVGIDLSGLIIVFGFLSVGIGFGLQNVTSNFVAGLILLFERPIRVGDRVTIGNVEGDVVEINIRSTTIRSLNNISIIVPNSEFIASQVTNWSHRDPKVRLDIDVGVSYGSRLEDVIRSLREVAMENDNILKKPEPDVLHLGFGDSSWNMRLRVWIADPKRHPYVRSEMNCAIVEKFRKNNVEIPFPQRDLHVRSPLPLPLVSKD